MAVSCLWTWRSGRFPFAHTISPTALSFETVVQPEQLAKLIEDLEAELGRGAKRIALIGHGATAAAVLRKANEIGSLRFVSSIFADVEEAATGPFGVPILPMHELRIHDHDVLVVAEDERKEELIALALPHIQECPKLLVAGYGHFSFRDKAFEAELAHLLVPSLANGYPNSLIHIYQCLCNAARLGLTGVVAEFGMYKGGTTMFMARVIRRLQAGWPIVAFDSFAGFPPRRSPLDMYDHPDCTFTDLESVKRYLAGEDVEVVPGDIAMTCTRLMGEDIVLSFIDTDNYTPANAAIAAVRDRTVVGGAIMFDHFVGVDRFRYTLGERMAAAKLLDDPRYFNLHGTGVFYRQR